MSGKVAALFVDPKGIYPKLLGADACWDEKRDARLYLGPDPVVAHPPCQLWVNLAAVNWKRYGRQKPAWYPGGNDDNCFQRALASVRAYGGVLEHPASSHAWEAYGLTRPVTANLPDFSGGCLARMGHGWSCVRKPSSLLAPAARCMGEWVCEVWQAAYGGKMRKRTWLAYCGKRPPFALCWERQPGTHQCGWFDRKKPTVSKREASATPLAFAEELIKLARWSRG